MKDDRTDRGVVALIFFAVVFLVAGFGLLFWSVGVLLFGDERVSFIEDYWWMITVGLLCLAIGFGVLCDLAFGNGISDFEGGGDE